MSVQSPAPLRTQSILHSLFSVFLTKQGLLTIAVVQFDLAAEDCLVHQTGDADQLAFWEISAYVSSVQRGTATLLANVSARPTNACAVAHQSVTNCTDWFGESGCNAVKQWDLFE